MNNDNQATQTWSIKSRLTFFYGLTTVLLLIVTTLFFYLTTLHILHHGNVQFLLDEISVLENLMENQPNNLAALQQEVSSSSYIDTNSEYRFYVRIADQNNKTILKTPFFKHVLSQSVFYKNNDTLPNKKIIHWNTLNKQYVLMQKKRLSDNPEKVIYIQVALDITYQQHIINHYSKLLAAVLFCIFLVAIILGYLIAQRAMQSLYRLTDAAQTITLSSLHERINPKFWPKELQSLGMAFNQMLGRIEKAVMHLTQFSGDLAHELRTPVNNLMGEAEVVLSKDHSNEKYREVLESHLEELQRLAKIIENILFLARTENPKWDIKKTPVHIAHEINLICEYYQAMADEKNICITQTGDAILHVNSTMFERMLSNLLSNALKYTAENGAIQFTIKEGVETVEIILQDTGIGIAAEHLPKLFNRFYRVDSARTRAAGGVGLGLPIVKSIVELHHGTITISSELNVGTKITLVFPK